jgi:CheY-like chemotaxis protein
VIRVLVVDDNRDSADALAEVLRQMGHTAEASYSGSEALVRVEQFSPDLFLLDLALPDIDGYELARRLRRVAHKDARFVALTGYGPGIGGNLAANVFDDHVVKPMSPEMLLKILGMASASGPTNIKSLEGGK